MAKHGCALIEDQPVLERDIPNWWFSLMPLTGADTDFMFFCQSSTDRLQFRLIVSVTGKSNPWQGCNMVVDSWREGPYSKTRWFLKAISTPDRLSNLDQWWLVSSSMNPKVSFGPAGVLTPGPLIDTTGNNSGAGTLYACYGQEWYRIGLD
jgi:hypothetical protein